MECDDDDESCVYCMEEWSVEYLHLYGTYVRTCPGINS